MTYDLAIVGAGIIGIAHAYAAAKRGMRTVVIDRDTRASGASVRNFGLAVVSGQSEGISRRRAERTREIWLDLASEAGIEVLHEGKLVVAQRPEALAVLEAYQAGPHGPECQLLTADEITARQPGLDRSRICGGLHSPHELRVESREAVPRLAAFLADRLGVDFRRGVAVTGVEPGMLGTSQGPIRADKIVVCPGDDLATLFPERIASLGARRCKLQMLRLAKPNFKLSSAIVSDLSLLRYGGYASLPETAALRQRLNEECREALDNGVHLIVAQSADGSLIVGDSHHYGDTDPFGSEAVDQLILAEFQALFTRKPDVIARWIGTYASAPAHEAFIDAPHPDIRLVMITNGTGASTGFAVGEETIDDLFD